MKFTALIPARLASTRLPRKPLADINGLPMVVRVARQAQRSGAAQVVVAADDLEIIQACQMHGVQAILTHQQHLSGSDRLAQACEILGLDGEELVVNVQGDEPLIEPALIEQCARTLQEHPGCVMSTVAHAIHDAADLANPNVVKVVLDAAGRALYFSRSAIPFWRDGPPARPATIATTAPTTPCAPGDGPAAAPVALRHVGIYAYRAGFLRRFPQLQPAPLELAEALEQLRVLWHGERIAVHVAAQAPRAGVDTPADLARVRALLA